VGATIAGLGFSEVKWWGDGDHLDGVLGKVVLPALASPFIALIVSAIGTKVVFAITRGVTGRYRDTGFRWGQIGTASLLSLSHGTNDAQKTMGMVTLALLAAGQWHDVHSIPFWVKVACAVAIALGTYIGGWRIIRTMGHGLVEVSSPQGMSAEAASAAVILSSSQLGFALSTTHVATGSILGTGLGIGAKVRWSVARRMVMAWLTTLPAAGVVGAIMYFIGHLIGGSAGSFTVLGLIILGAGGMFIYSRRDKISHHNVNAEWKEEAK
jgi:PiT family inorganic phosphate transporter